MSQIMTGNTDALAAEYVLGTLDPDERTQARAQPGAHVAVELDEDCEIAGRAELNGHNAASAEFGISVTNMLPGLCVIMNGGLEASATACGVTPQAQNTGMSPGAMCCASP